MYKRLFNAVITSVGFTLLFAACTKHTDKHITFATQIDVTKTVAAADQNNVVMYFSTDGGLTFRDGVPPNKVGQKFNVMVFNNTSNPANGYFLTSASFVPDWSGSNPAPSNPTSDMPEFTYTGSNLIKVSFTDLFCTYDPSYWTGAWGGDEVGACCGGTDANNITQDLVDPTKYTMDNFWGDGVDAYFIMNPSTSFATQTLTIPVQTTSEGGVASGTGTYDQCGGTFTIATEYKFPGLTDLNVLALGRGNTSGSRMYAATASTFFFSANAGGSWSAQSTSLASTPVRAIVTPKVTANTNVFVSTSTGVLHSADRGVTWTAANSGLTNTDVTGLLQTGTTTLYAATNGGGVFTSTDNAVTWTAINTGITNLALSSLAISGTNFYAGVVGGGAFKSTDGGLTWTPFATDIKNTFTSLAVSGTNIYAGTANGLFVSNDNGSTWTVSDFGNVTGVAVQGINTYAASATSGVYHSVDNGATWTAIDNKLTSQLATCLESATATSSSTDPNAMRLFVGTSDAGAFVTTNQGTGWSTVSNGSDYVFQYNFHKP